MFPSGTIGTRFPWGTTLWSMESCGRTGMGGVQLVCCWTQWFAVSAPADCRRRSNLCSLHGPRFRSRGWTHGLVPSHGAEGTLQTWLAWSEGKVRVTMHHT